MPSYRHLSGKKSTWFRQEIDPRPRAFELPALLIHGFDLLLQRSLQISFQNLHRLGLAVVEAHVVGREGELLHGQSGVAGAPPEDRRRRRHRRARRRRRATVHRRRFPSLSLSLYIAGSDARPASAQFTGASNDSEADSAGSRAGDEGETQNERDEKREREREWASFSMAKPFGPELKNRAFAPPD